MTKSKHFITYAGKSIPFHLSYSNRKVMEISVRPDGRVVVKAPLGTNKDLIERCIHKRAYWINRQLRHFEQFEPRTPKRRFIGGESHLYLGRKYRLKIRRSETKKVSLTHGYFHIASPDTAPEQVAKLLNEWYRRKAEICFSRALEKCWHSHRFPKKGVEKPTLKIRTMKTRWGSLSKRGGVTLNLELVKAPVECIEYVVVHELCHLFHPNHGKAFHNLLEKCLPDWQKRKHKLETIMS